MQGSGGLGLRLAPRRQLSGRQRLALGCFRLLAGALGDNPHRQIFRALRLGKLGGGGNPTQVKQRRLGLAHLLGNRAVADRVPGLALESIDLALHLRIRDVLCIGPVDDVHDHRDRDQLLHDAQREPGLDAPPDLLLDPVLPRPERRIHLAQALMRLLRPALPPLRNGHGLFPSPSLLWWASPWSLRAWQTPREAATT